MTNIVVTQQETLQRSGLYVKLLTLTWNFPSFFLLEQLSLRQGFCSSLPLSFLLCRYGPDFPIHYYSQYAISGSFHHFHLWLQLNSPKLPAWRESQLLLFLSEPTGLHSSRPIRGVGTKPSFLATRWFAHLDQVIRSGFILHFILSNVEQEHISFFLLIDISHRFQFISGISQIRALMTLVFFRARAVQVCAKSNRNQHTEVVQTLLTNRQQEEVHVCVCVCVCVHAFR